MTLGKCLSRAHYCPVRAGQPSCVLYTTVINNIFLENVCSFVVLIGGVEVKCKGVLHFFYNLIVFIVKYNIYI